MALNVYHYRLVQNFQQQQFSSDSSRDTNWDKHYVLYVYQAIIPGFRKQDNLHQQHVSWSSLPLSKLSNNHLMQFISSAVVW